VKNFCFLILLSIAFGFGSSCAQESEDRVYSSEDFVGQINKDEGKLDIKETVELDGLSEGFAESGHRFLGAISPSQLMDCSINNFLTARILQSSPGYYEGDPDTLLADISVIDSVFRNALFGAGFDTEQKREKVYGETILAKLVVTEAGATETEILAAKKEVEGFCESSINRAYLAYEADLRAESSK